MQRLDWECKDFIYSDLYPKMQVDRMDIIIIEFVGKKPCITPYKHLNFKKFNFNRGESC